MSRLRRKAAIVAAGLVMLAALAVGARLVAMARADREHERFYAAGVSVKAFLVEYCGRVRAAVAAGDPQPVVEMYSPRYLAPQRGAWVLRPAGAEGGAEVLELARSSAHDYELGQLKTELRDYLTGLGAVSELECRIQLIQDLDPDRWVSLTVRYVLAGTDAGGRLLEDRFSFRWRLERDSGPEGWRIVRDELVGGARTLQAAPEAFVALDLPRAGIDYRHQRPAKLDRERHADELAFDLFAHASGGVAAVDYDLDGRDDLFFADGVRSRLYRNLGLDDAGRPVFADVTSAAGLGDLGDATAGLFADFDNDGDRDLFVARYLAPSRLFVNDGAGRFEDRSAEAGLDFVAPASGGTLLDFDRDGDLDLYVGAYGNVFESVPRLPFFATNGTPNLLFRNAGGLRFENVTEATGTGGDGWTLAVAAADYDGDGWTDLGVANDFGRKDLYRNRGDGTFEEVARAAGVLDFSAGMGLLFSDLDSDGRLDLYTSNIYSNTRWFGREQTIEQYLRNIQRSRWAIVDLAEFWKLYRLIGSEWRHLGYQIGEGNSVFLNGGDGTFEEIEPSAASVAGWGWGVAALDYDNDTDLDLYAANGWISATPETDL